MRSFLTFAFRSSHWPYSTPGFSLFWEISDDHWIEVAVGSSYDGLKPSRNAIGHAMHSSRSHDAVIRVYDSAGNVTETHTYKSEFKKGKKFRNIVVYDKQ